MYTKGDTFPEKILGNKMNVKNGRRIASLLYKLDVKGKGVKTTLHLFHVINVYSRSPGPRGSNLLRNCTSWAEPDLREKRGGRAPPNYNCTSL